MQHQPVRQGGHTTTPGTLCSTLFDKCVTLKMQETEYLNSFCLTEIMNDVNLSLKHKDINLFRGMIASLTYEKRKIFHVTLLHV